MAAASIERVVPWAPWEGAGLESLRLSVNDQGVAADGVVIGDRDGTPFRIRYRIRCDGNWRLRSRRARGVRRTSLANAVIAPLGRKIPAPYIKTVIIV